MAMADYRLCDVCGGKSFYDANLNYEYPDGHDGPGIRNAGEVEPGLGLERVGDWVVICKECSKKYKAVIALRGAPDPQEGQQ